MGTLEEITQMRSQGMAENEIISSLQEKGIDPKSINDALSQSQIKSAVTGEEGLEEMPANQTAPAPEQVQEPSNYSPRTQEISENAYAPNTAPQESYAQDQYSEEEDYGSYDNNYGGGGIGADTFVEIAEQVFVEKNKHLQKQLDEISEFKALAEVKLNQATERIKRIEEVMDKLQMAILEKVGAYGNSLEGIKREMTMMQDSFGKMVPDLAQKTNHNTSKKHVVKRK